MSSGKEENKNDNRDQGLGGCSQSYFPFSLIVAALRRAPDHASWSNVCSREPEGYHDTECSIIRTASINPAERLQKPASLFKRRLFEGGGQRTLPPRPAAQTRAIHDQSDGCRRSLNQSGAIAVLIARISIGFI